MPPKNPEKLQKFNRDLKIISDKNMNIYSFNIKVSGKITVNYIKEYLSIILMEIPNSKGKVDMITLAKALMIGGITLIILWALAKSFGII